jgi:hypothetical protein
LQAFLGLFAARKKVLSFLVSPVKTRCILQGLAGNGDYFGGCSVQQDGGDLITLLFDRK